MFEIWRYLWKFTPPASGFRGLEERRMVTRRCLKWARVVTKYKMVRTKAAEGDVVMRIPDEWGLRCLKWAPMLVKPPRKGTRSFPEFKPVTGPEKRHFKNTKYMYRGKPFESCR
jgi:hypothetical protein